MRSRRTLSLTPHWACRWSLITLCAESVGPSTAEVSLSSSESAKGRAAAQANNELHLRIHAGCARPRNSSGSSRTLAVQFQLESASNFTNKDDELGPASVTHQLTVPPFLSAPCHSQACSTLNHGSKLGLTCSGQRTH